MWDLLEKGNRTAAIDDGGRVLTYKELEELACELKSIAHRKLCFNLCKNELGSLAGYVSMLEAGVVPVMLAADMDNELLKSLILNYEPDFIWCSEEDRKIQLDVVLSDNTSSEEKALEIKSTGIVCKNYSLYKTSFENSEPIDEHLALLLTTSGSTGSPKFVRQSYDNIIANTESIIDYLKIDENEKPITTLPMNYTYGLSIINTHIWVGATILITDKTLMDRGFWNFFRDEGATSFGGVPYTYEILDKLRLTRMNLPTLKTMTQAGGKLSLQLHEKLAKFAAETDRHFVVMYGQTEATARMGYLPADKALDKIGSMGIAIPGGEFTLIDVDGKSITEPDTTGELIYKGANVTLGYAESRADLSKEDERGGVLVTGDMARFDADGYFYIVGRKKRFLKIYGKRVNMDEVDRLVRAEYPEIDAATVGSDDHMKIYISLNDAESINIAETRDNDLKDELRKFISNKLKINLAAIEVYEIEEIPRSESGKVLYSKFTD